jgi:hypothetical protein
MAFVLAVLLFVAVTGVIDAGLPWLILRRRGITMIAGHLGFAAAVKATGTASSTLGFYAGDGLVGCAFVPFVSSQDRDN